MPAPDPALSRLTDQILAARPRGVGFDIVGGGTKGFFGELPRGEPLLVRELRGICSYEPSELVVTARAGTPLRELEQTLAAQGQCLPFEPPRFQSGASVGGTVGGMVAAGIAGPARPSAGSLRDYVLGATLLNGRGELLTFGGQVMKNVAGYDVSRLLAGSWGVLGVICEVSLKVMASRAATATLCFELDEKRALEQLARLSARPLPLSASAWHEDRLRVRLSGARAAVRSACENLRGMALEPEAAVSWWGSVRDHAHPFFTLSEPELARGERLWRLSVPATAAPFEFSGAQFIEWGGAQRWWRTSAPVVEVRAAAARAGGHATVVRGDKTAGAFAPVSESLMRIHRALKTAFDPDRIFNVGRLYADL
jgi:FAD/FMN-containing dehydrogenase